MNKPLDAVFQVSRNTLAIFGLLALVALVATASGYLVGHKLLAEQSAALKAQMAKIPPQSLTGICPRGKLK